VCAELHVFCVLEILAGDFEPQQGQGMEKRAKPANPGGVAFAAEKGRSDWLGWTVLVELVQIAAPQSVNGGSNLAVTGCVPAIQSKTGASFWPDFTCELNHLAASFHTLSKLQTQPLFANFAVNPRCGATKVESERGYEMELNISFCSYL